MRVTQIDSYDCDACLDVGRRFEFLIHRGGIPFTRARICTGMSGTGCPTPSAVAFGAQLKGLKRHLDGMTSRDRASDNGRAFEERYRNDLKRTDQHIHRDAIIVNVNQEVALKCRLREIRKWSANNCVTISTIDPVDLFDAAHFAGWGEALSEDAMAALAAGGAAKEKATVQRGAEETDQGDTPLTEPSLFD